MPKPGGLSDRPLLLRSSPRAVVIHGRSKERSDAAQTRG
jgi:hypothetical protein